MNIEELRKEREYLQSVVDEATKRLAKAPEGVLHLSPTRGYIQYRLYCGKKGKYFSKRKNLELFKIYSQKQKDLKIIKQIPEQIEIFDNFLAKYNPKLLNELIEPEVEAEEKIDKSVSDASTEVVKMADDTDLARNLIAICEAFLKSKGC